MTSPTNNTGGAGRVHHLDPLAKTQIQKKPEKKLEKDAEKVDNARQSIHEGEGEKKSEITGETSTAQFPPSQTEQPEVDRLKETVMKGKADAHIPRKLERQEAKGNLFKTTQQQAASAKESPKVPAKNEEEKSTKAASKLETQEHIDHFMNGMNLKHIPEKTVMGFNDLRELSKALGNTIDNPDAPALPPEQTQSVIGQYFHSLEPLYRRHSEISEFAQEQQPAFNKYVQSLPDQTDVDKAKADYDAIKKKIDNPDPEVMSKLSDPEKKKYVKSQLYALKEAGNTLSNVQRKAEMKAYFLQKPSLLAALNIQQHQRNYTIATGEIPKALERNKLNDMKVYAAGLWGAEKEFQAQIGLAIDVLNDNEFIKLLEPKVEKKAKKGQEKPHPAKPAVQTLVDLRVMKRELDKVVDLYKEMADSIKEDPQGWYDALYTKIDRQPAG